MLVKPTMENLLQKVSSRYVLTILAAKRARQLVDGAQPMAKSETPNYVTTACEEIAVGAVLPVRGIHEVHVPLRPEVEAERLREEIEKRNARYREDMEEESNARIRSLIAATESDESDGDDESDTADAGEAVIPEVDGEDVIPEDDVKDIILVDAGSADEEETAEDDPAEPEGEDPAASEGEDPAEAVQPEDLSEAAEVEGSADFTEILFDGTDGSADSGEKDEKPAKRRKSR